MHSCHSIRRKHTTQHSDHLQKRCGALDALIEASTDMFIKLQDLLLHSGFTVRSLIVIVYCLMCFDSLGLLQWSWADFPAWRHAKEWEACLWTWLSKSKSATTKSKTAVPNIRTAVWSQAEWSRSFRAAEQSQREPEVADHIPSVSHGCFHCGSWHEDGLLDPMGLFCVSQAWALVLRDQFSESGHGSSPQVYLRIACPPMCPKLTIEALLLLAILKHRLVLEIRFWYGIDLCKVSALPAAASDRFSQYRRRSEDRSFGQTWQIQSYKQPCVNCIDKYLYIYVCMCIRIPITM